MPASRLADESGQTWLLVVAKAAGITQPLPCYWQFWFCRVLRDPAISARYLAWLYNTSSPFAPTFGVSDALIIPQNAPTYNFSANKMPIPPAVDSGKSERAPAQTCLAPPHQHVSAHTVTCSASASFPQRNSPTNAAHRHLRIALRPELPHLIALYIYLDAVLHGDSLPKKLEKKYVWVLTARGNIATICEVHISS